MRTLKLTAVALALALAGAVYAAGAMQGAAPQAQEGAKPSKSCCQMHDGKRAAPHDAAKHEGKGCCCTHSGGGDCCGDACSNEHHKGGHAVAQKTAAGAEKTAPEHSCCYAGGACGEGHADAKTRAAAKDGGGCCKAHKSDTPKVAAQTNAAKDGGDACGPGSCACCAGKADRKARASGR